MRRAVVAALLASVLAGCAEPVFVPEAGPHAPGYREVSTPPPPRVELVREVDSEERADPEVGGVVDGVARKDGLLTIDGWAMLRPDAPRGTLLVVLPSGSRAGARVEDVKVAQRPDVVQATGDDKLVWAGFSISVSGVPGSGTAVCIVSRSRYGTYRLGGSDARLCSA